MGKAKKNGNVISGWLFVLMLLVLLFCFFNDISGVAIIHSHIINDIEFVFKRIFSLLKSMFLF